MTYSYYFVKIGINGKFLKCKEEQNALVTCYSALTIFVRLITEQNVFRVFFFLQNNTLALFTNHIFCIVVSFIVRILN